MAYPGEGRGPAPFKRLWTPAFAGVLISLLAACDSSPDNALPGASDDRIECAAAGTETFEAVCTIERMTNDKGELVLTVRDPTGGFRRLLVTKDGRGVIAADGAEPAKVSVIEGNRIEVVIAGDRYRLPATVKTP